MKFSHINKIEINNFKSLQDVKITGCKRINLFIGRSNAGKSNILEALSVFSIPYLKENSSKKLNNLIRLQNESELFYNGNADLNAEISTNIGNCYMSYTPKEGLNINIDFIGHAYEKVIINDRLKVSGLKPIKKKNALSVKNDFEPPIKRYNFKTDVLYKKAHAKYLIPPFGYNLLSVIEHYPSLKKEVTDLFSDFGLEIAFDKSSHTIKIIQSDKKGIFLIPYNSIADTLQRIIFFKAAIASNNNSILLFEEPEAHSFPPYLTHITQEMIYKNDNQYFIATHSPFILNDLLENSPNELAVYNVYFERNETKVKLLTDKKLLEIFNNGIDLFTNIESFI